jgi:GMP synthase-like glutamine amidotransferase
MRVLLVENYDSTGPGLVGRALAEAGIAADPLRAHRGEALPSGPDGWRGMVVLGGGQSAVDDAEYPYLPGLAALMRAFVDDGRPVLGICLGAQVLARAFGARNLIGAAPEFGWQEVALTPKGRDDPVLGRLPDRFPVFQWHDDTFTLPPGAARLAGNGTARNQAFRVGRAGYGIQFHFEVDRELVRRWNADFAATIATRHPGWPARHPAEEALHGGPADAAGLAIARAWVGLLGP